MLTDLKSDIKRMQGINNEDFDGIINNFINSAKQDLAMVGIAKFKIDEEDPLIYSAIISYVLSHIDTSNSELYSNSYLMQKDALRHMGDYQ